jgi:hypothetical protein
MRFIGLGGIHIWWNRRYIIWVVILLISQSREQRDAEERRVEVDIQSIVYDS